MKKTIEEIRNMTIDEIRTCISESSNRMRELKNAMGMDVYDNEEYRNLDTLVCDLLDEEDERFGYHDHLFINNGWG